jgi:LacI family transcriptional regulator
MGCMGFARVGDVAARAGVSAGTVSNYFHNPERVAADTAERIRSAVEALGYVPNGAARSLRRGETRTIGLLTFEVANPYSADFVQAIDDRAQDLGYSVITANSAGDPAREDSYLELFVRQRVDGVILSPVGTLPDRASSVAEHGIPLVLTDTADTLRGFSSVSVDDVEGGRLAASHLLSLGHRRLCFAGRSAQSGIVARRLEGVQLAIATCREAELRVVDLEERTIAGGRSIGEQLLALAAGQRPSGVIAVNDLVAIGVLHASMSALRVPEEFGIVGFDDIDFAAEAVIPLTSVRRSVRSFAATAVDNLHAQIVGSPPPTVSLLDPELIIRNSTVRPA